MYLNFQKTSQWSYQRTILSPKSNNVAAVNNGHFKKILQKQNTTFYFLLTQILNIALVSE